MRGLKVGFLLFVLTGNLAAGVAQILWLRHREPMLWMVRNYILGSIFLVMGLVFSFGAVFSPKWLSFQHRQLFAQDTRRRRFALGVGILSLIAGVIALANPHPLR